MAGSQEIICLSSDRSSSEEDDAEEELLRSTFLTRRRRRRPSVSARTTMEPSSSHNSSPSGSEALSNQKTDCIKHGTQSRDENHANMSNPPENVKQKRPMELQPKRKLPESSVGIKSDSNDEDDEDDSVLEVLPAKGFTPSSHLSSAKQGPRLSFSGQAAKDALDLLEEGEEEESPIPNNLRARLVARMKDNVVDPSEVVEAAPLRKPSSRVSAAGETLAQSFDDSYHSRSDVKASQTSSASSLGYNLPSPSPNTSILDTKPSAVPHLNPKDSDSCFTDSSNSGDDLLDNPGVSDQLAATSRKTSTLHLSNSDDSDSDDDSFTAKCRAFDRHRAKSQSENLENQSRRPKTAKPARRSTKATSGNAKKASEDQNIAQKRKTKEERDLVRQQRKEQKELEKIQAKKKRDRDRLAEEQAKKEAKRQKREQREKSNQARGWFANQEIAVLVEPSVLESTQHAWNIQSTLSGFGFDHVRAYQSGLSCNAIQFIRQNFLHGGAERALEELVREGSSNARVTTYEHIPVLAIIVEATTFVSLIQGEDDRLSPRGGNFEDDDYPELEQWLFGLIEGWRVAWRKTAADRPRVILLLCKIKESLDRLWVQYNASGRRGPTPPTTEQFHDAVLWMLIQFQIESIHCDTAEDVAHEVYKMTRFLADAPYVKQATDLQTFAKLPAHISDMAPSFDRARDTWIRQLQQIPRVSADMAHNISMHYPTALSLWNVYQDDALSTFEKQTLLSDLFGTKSSQSKLSYHIYQALTSDNPQEILR